MFEEQYKEKFVEMMWEESDPLKFKKEFEEFCLKYNESSLIPYEMLKWLIIEEQCPMEEYYLQVLVELYEMYAVDDTFLEILQEILSYHYCDKYIEEVHQSLSEYIKDGYVIAYRGEFSDGKRGNKDYKESVSYSIDYEEAKFFATRFANVIELDKSVVYTVKVPVEDIVGYNEREDEIICIPVSIGGKMEVIKTENFV